MILVYVALAWCAGIVAAAQLSLPWWLIVLGGGAFAGGSLPARRGFEGGLALLLTAVAVGGMLHYESTLPERARDGVARFNDGDAVVLRGMVEDDPERREQSQLVRVKVDAYRDADGAWVAVEGRILATLRLFPEYEYGDFVELTGEIETPEPFEGFDYREYLLRQEIESVSLYPTLRRTGSGGGSDLRRALNAVRNELAGGINAAMPEPEASLANGILLGKRSSIPDDVNDDFKNSGLAHLIAISGYNVMLVSTFMTGLLWPLIGRRPAVVVSILAIVLFAAFVGAEPSVLRATAMGAVVLGADFFGRPRRGFVALVLIVGLLLASDPLLIDEVSFQLSVVATAGIVLGARRLADAMDRLLQGRLPGGATGFIAEQTAVTVAASIAVLPVLATAFGRVSTISVLANIVAAPAFAVALLASLASALVGVVSDDLARLAGEATHLPLAYLVFIARLAGGVPGATVAIGQFGAVALACALCGLGVLIFRSHYAGDEQEPEPRVVVSRTLLAAAVLSLVAAVVLIDIATPRDARLEVTVLDVGQGDAILIETPDGRVVLVDGGPSVSRLLNQLGASLPARERRIDLVVLTHPQEDHVAGLAGLLERYEVGRVLTGPQDGTVASYRALRDALISEDVPVVLAQAGLVAGLGDGIALEVLAPSDPLIEAGDDLNENSVVLRLVYGEVAFLLTGDIGFDGEEALLTSGADLRASVLKVGHHGSDGSTSPAFLEAVAPGIAVISAGEDNPFGHPSPTTRLRLAGIPTLRTDLNGRVTFATNGRRLWVEAEQGTAELVMPSRGEIRGNPD